jgi:hypothetical protein
MFLSHHADFASSGNFPRAELPTMCVAGRPTQGGGAGGQFLRDLARLPLDLHAILWKPRTDGPPGWRTGRRRAQLFSSLSESLILSLYGVLYGGLYERLRCLPAAPGTSAPRTSA